MDAVPRQCLIRATPRINVYASKDKIKDIGSPIFKPPLNMYIDLLFQLGLAISGDRDGAADGTHQLKVGGCNRRWIGIRTLVQCHVTEIQSAIVCMPFICLFVFSIYCNI